MLTTTRVVFDRVQNGQRGSNPFLFIVVLDLGHRHGLKPALHFTFAGLLQIILA